jgi:uncharacterized membrane protein YhaH (DUF805 family)
MSKDGQYWFPAKRYGWGWGPPIRWQGWAVLFIWFMVMAVAGIRLMQGHIAAFLSLALLMVVLLLFICYVKGEPPRWRWGKRE